MECQINDISVYYEARGEGRPIIMLHGLGGSHVLMVRYMESAFVQREGWKRIYLDLPGIGNTKAPERIHNSDQMLEVVLDFIEAVLPGQSFSLAGYSYGGYLARGVISRKFELVDGLLLICPVIIAQHSKRNLLAIPENLRSFQLAQTQRAWDKFEAERKPEKPPDPALMTRLETESTYPFSFDLDTSSFEKPTLIVAGRQDTIVGYRDAWDILENYARATFAALDMASHGLVIEQEKLFNALLDDWLDRVEQEPNK
jgi:pimeloyl-ACP methyl ester carboxylesterase